ncbi:MAG: efflux RND transporter periplasmic adaptor subunit, partial [Pirellulales bacterium]
ALAEAQAERAKKTHGRYMELVSRDAKTVPREDMDRAIEDLRVAESMIQARKEQLAQLTKGTRAEELAGAKAELAEAKAALQLAKEGYRNEEKDQARAEMGAAEAAVAAIQAQVSELKVVANVAGTVDALELQPGDLVAPNSPVLTLLDLDHLWLRAYIPENQLSLKPGDKVDVTVDSFPGKKFQGEIAFVAGQGEFTPRNVQTPEERAKQVFRVKVRLPSNSGLRVGMGADLWLSNKTSGSRSGE